MILSYILDSTYYSIVLKKPAVSQIQEIGDLGDLQGDVIYTSIFTLLIYYTYLISAFISTRNTISHHISVRDATSPGFASPYEKKNF